MNCEHPILAFRYYHPELGKSAISFKTHSDDNLLKLKKKYGDDNVFEFGCGQCEACRKRYSKEWSIRLTLEREYWNFGYFITLTYADEFNPASFIPSDKLASSDNPEALILSQYHYYFKDIQKFLKRCRKHLGSIAYYGVSELGSQNQRLHYHLVLFSNKPIDLHDGSLFNGHLYYRSDFLKNQWKYGIYKVGEFHPNQAAYVAKYTSKDKIQAFMSRSIGKRYFFDNYQKIVNNGFYIYGHFGSCEKVFCPSFMVQWFKELDDLSLDDIRKIYSDYAKALSEDKQRLLGCSNPEDINSVQNRINYKSKKRGDF